MTDQKDKPSTDKQDEDAGPRPAPVVVGVVVSDEQKKKTFKQRGVEKRG